MSTLPPLTSPNIQHGPFPPASQEAQETKNLSDLDTQLTEKNIKMMIRDPHSSQSRALFDRLRPLLTPDTVRALLRGPNAHENAKVLQAMGKHLSREHVTSCLKTVRDDASKTVNNQLKLESFQYIAKAFDEGGIEEIIGQYNSSKDRVTALGKNFSTMASTAKSLTDIGGSLTKDNLDAVRARPADTPAQPPTLPNANPANTQIQF